MISFFGLSAVSNAQVKSDKHLDSLSSLAYRDTSNFSDSQKMKLSSELNVIKPEDFNLGAISDVAMLLQGKVAGLSIYNRGGDPNKTGIVQVRGINTMGSYIEPLIVIDGIVGASLYNIDPNDIANIEVLKDGASCAKYGMRGSMGVINIITKKAGLYLPNITYNGQTGMSASLGGVNVMSADEFRSAGGVDFGSNTDWVKEITRQGLISNHHLSAQLNKGKTGIRLSGNYRDVEGILKSSGFRQINVRSNFKTSLLNDRLKINLNGSYTNRKSDVSFKEAFQYAISANPTMPVYAKDATFPFNSALYGGYSEAYGLYDYYNPVSILNQSSKFIESNALNINGYLSYQITPDFIFHTNYGYQNLRFDHRAFFPTTAYYKGIINLAQKGLVELLDEKENFHFLESKAQYNRNFKILKLNLNAGYSIQQMRYTSKFTSLADFKNVYIFSEFEEKIDTSQGSIFKSIAKYGPQDRIISYFTEAKLNIKDILLLEGTLRKDGSSRLGENKKWGVFHSLNAAVNVTQLASISKVNQLVARIGYGITGSLPQAYGLSQNNDQVFIVQDSTYIKREWDANPDLKWEEKRSVNFGLDYSRGRFSSSFDIYNSISKVFILESYLWLIWAFKYNNMNTIQTNGIELMLNYKVVNDATTQYNTGLFISSYKSVLKKIDIEIRPFIGYTYLNGGNILLQEGEEIGSIVGPVFDGLTEKGEPTYKDINNDGKFIVDYTTFSGIEDLAILGKGTPDVELGWSHKLGFGKWSINAFFRGVFGHSLINVNRLTNEPKISKINRIKNFVITPKNVEGLTVSRFHSLYVEKADFIKLDNITISRKIGLKKFSKIGNMFLSLTGQNIFTITKYTGGDPEPNLVDYNNEPYSVSQLINRIANTVITPGVDYTNNYFSSRNFVFCLSLEL